MQHTTLPATLKSLHAHLQIEQFDPHNERHIEAFVMLTQKGRQHPSLRFVLEHPYLDVRSMMYDKVARAYVEQFNREQAAA